MHNNKTLISVLMSIYNSEKTLEKAISSVLEQTYKNFEFLICDDGSTDGTSKILKKFEKIDKRIKIIKNNQNLGLTKSLNSLIQISKGAYIARQDGDDHSHPERLKTQLSLCLDKNYKVVVSRAIDVANNKLIPNYSYYVPYKLLIKFRNPFIHGSLFISSKTLNEIGNYDERFYYAQDYKLFREIVDERIKIKKIWNPIYFLNTKDNISTKFKKDQKYFADCVRTRSIPR